MKIQSLMAVVVLTAAAAVSSCGGVDSGKNGGTDSPTPTPTNTGVTPTPTATPIGGETLRFVVLGDTGKANTEQYAIATALAAKCAADGCDFGVLLGDNFYDSGVSAVDDPQFATKFEQPYGDMNTFPWYITLGNHDYGGGGAGYDFPKGKIQVQYSMQHPNFVLPAEYFSFEATNAMFANLGTNLILWDNAEGSVAGQGEYFKVALEAATQPWKIVLGHHPYISNGPHGNAGNYDNLPFIPIANGANVKKFFDDSICGKADLYINGHDHSRQILPGTASCPMTFVVSGAGASTTTLSTTNPSLFQSDAIGFTYFIVTPEKITIQMLDVAGNVDFTHEMLHP